LSNNRAFWLEARVSRYLMATLCLLTYCLEVGEKAAEYVYDLVFDPKPIEVPAE